MGVIFAECLFPIEPMTYMTDRRMKLEFIGSESITGKWLLLVTTEYSKHKHRTNNQSQLVAVKNVKRK